MPQPNPSRDERQPALSRRTVFAGAGVAGAAAAAAVVLPSVMQQSAPEPSAKVIPGSSEGYQLTEHVQRYYRTAKV